jgi:hypothetical protein
VFQRVPSQKYLECGLGKRIAQVPSLFLTYQNWELLNFVEFQFVVLIAGLYIWMF